ncbi:MAG: 16S rRNA (guanine(966)-N(2))-methyltransferase RsmD [Myxococcota bacterium]
MREAVFNILRSEVEGAKVADFFAGTGAMGLEALSRGAESALFVEKSFGAAKLIEQNIELLGYGEKAELIKGDVFTVSRKLVSSGLKFDIIFLDPPYEGDECGRLFDSDFIAELLAEGGVAALEAPSKSKIVRAPKNLKITDRREWGKCGYLFLELVDSK